MPDQSLEILIKTLADTHGAEAVGNALDKLKSKKDDHGNVVNVTDKDIEAAEKYAKSLEEQGKHAEFLGLKHGALHKVIHQLGEEFPIAGGLARALFNPIVFGITSAIALFGSFKEQITELGNASTPEFERLTGAVEAQKKAIEAVDLAARAYDRSLKALSSSSETIQAATGAALAAAKTQSEQRLALAEATKSKEQTFIETAERLGLVSHEDALKRKLALDEQFIVKRLKLESDAEHQAIQLKLNEQYRLYAEMEKLESGLAAKRAAVRQAEKAALLLEGRQGNNAKDIDKTEAKIDDLEKELKGLQGFHPFRSAILLGQQIEDVQGQIESQRDILQKLRQANGNPDRLLDAKDAAARARESLDRDQGRLTSDAEAHAGLGREIPRDQAAAASAQASRAAVAAQDATAVFSKGFADIATAFTGTMPQLITLQEQMRRELDNINRRISALSPRMP